MSEQDEIDNLEADSFDIVPTHLAVQAMRDNGYKNAAYALAELIDNSIQAGAKMVEILCLERESLVKVRSHRRLDQIAVLDNGEGMTSDVLRMALQFGNGTRLTTEKQNGIGKFGMGLPAASISQCARVDVWTWQNGPESALHTYLDLGDIKERKQSVIPVPETAPIPAEWRDMSREFGPTGTLVVWSMLDRCRWNTARALMDNTEEYVGRLYRKFLDKGNLVLRFIRADWNPISGFVANHLPDNLAPNDPGYLMRDTTCPPPFDAEPMFEPWAVPGYSHRRTISIPDGKGKKFPVTLTFSVARPEARAGHNSGQTPYGQHAKRNIGVSLVRAERELELDQGFVSQYDPTERWWGVEVSFPPALDDVFGVTNNKQSARYFAEISRANIEELIGDATIHEAMSRMAEEGDPRGPLLYIANEAKNELKKIRDRVKEQGREVGRNSLGYANTTPGATGGDGSAAPRPVVVRPTRVEAIANRVVEQRIQAGHESTADAAPPLPPDEKRELLREILIKDGVTETEADRESHRIVAAGLKFNFAHAPLDDEAFFSLKTISGTIIIELNTNHPAYENLIEILEQDPDRITQLDDLRDRLEKAGEGLRLLLMAWARYESEQPEGPRRSSARAARTDWGRVARDFLTNEEN